MECNLSLYLQLHILRKRYVYSEGAKIKGKVSDRCVRLLCMCVCRGQVGQYDSAQ